jgi:hypothetical protein
LAENPRLKFLPELVDHSGMSIKSILAALLLAGACAAAQSESAELAAIRDSAGAHYDREDLVSGRPIPVPVLTLGPSLMGGGYAVFAYRAEGGLNMEATHIVFHALAAYDNGHKVDDGDQPNPKGHDRYLEGAIYFRPARPGWTRMFYLGAGYRWSQLSTTNYTKGGSRPEFGGGYDWFLRSCSACRRDYSMRIEMNWLAAGSDWQNGSHGPETNLIWPSPREKRHWFYHEKIAVYRFHETITEPSNLPLTRQQLSHRSFNGFTDFGVTYRF